MEFKLLFQNITLWLFLCWIAITIGATVYQMVVCVPAWDGKHPESLVAFLKVVNPGTFWRSPLLGTGLLAGIATMVLHWGTVRQPWLLGSVGLGIIATVVTALWFIPRLKTMGMIDGHVPLDNPALVAKTLREWVIGDHLRFWVLVVPAFLLGLKALSTPV